MNEQNDLFAEEPNGSSASSDTMKSSATGKESMTDEQSVSSRVDALRQEINQHNYRYY